MANKREVIILTKTDVINDPKELAKKIKEAKKLNPDVLTVSVYDDAAIKVLADSLIKILREESVSAKDVTVTETKTKKPKKDTKKEA